MKNSVLLLVILILLLVPFSARAAFDGEESTDSEETAEQQIAAEIELIASKLELGAWQRFFDEASLFNAKNLGSVEQMLVHYAQSGADDSPDGIWQVLTEAVKRALAGAFGAAAALALASLMTGLASALPHGETRPIVSFALSAVAVLLTAGVFSSLCAKASDSITRAADFTEAAIPVMTALLTSAGALTTAGIFRPLMLFLSSTLVSFMRHAVMPLILAGGALSIVDCLCDGGKLAELIKFIQKAVKWLIGLAAVIYFGICALQGMTASAADGVALRAAKYAADKLLPSTGGLIGGTADTFIDCALLVKNGAGITAVLLMTGIMAEPLISIGIGSLVFRAAAAVSRPAAEPAAVKMLSGAADMTSCLFGAAAVAGAMFILTVLVFTAAGGALMGSW